MAVDFSTQHYYEAGSSGGTYTGKVYHYDPTGNREIAVWREAGFPNREAALDAAQAWCEANGIEAEMT